MTTQHSPWLPWFAREVIRFWFSFRAQWNRWRMWRHPRQSEDFKRHFRLAMHFNKQAKG